MNLDLSCWQCVEKSKSSVCLCQNQPCSTNTTLSENKL